MFEKEAKEYLKKDGTKAELILNMLKEVSPLKIKVEQVPYMLAMMQQIYQDGAEFGYNKANEWHYVKDGDLPNTDTQNYTYIRRRKKYERQFTDYRVIKCFVLCLNESGKTTAEIGYFDCNKKCFLDKAEGFIYAWKEIVLPELKESE